MHHSNILYVEYREGRIKEKVREGKEEKEEKETKGRRRKTKHEGIKERKEKRKRNTANMKQLLQMTWCFAIKMDNKSDKVILVKTGKEIFFCKS